MPVHAVPVHAQPLLAQVAALAKVAHSVSLPLQALAQLQVVAQLAASRVPQTPLLPTHAD